MKGNIHKKGLVLLTIIAIALVIAFGFYLEKSKSNSKIEIQSLDSEKGEDSISSKENAEPVEENNSTNQVNTKEEVQDKKLLTVDVSGAVNNPGIYELEEGLRVNDAIEAAGGISETANSEYISKYINRAKKLIDGQKIYIPLITDSIEDMETGSGGIESFMDGSAKLINLNTATKEQLMTLNGIGESYAERIIEYREKNGFKSIEDLKNVKGIGEKRFEELKDYVTVE